MQNDPANMIDPFGLVDANWIPPSETITHMYGSKVPSEAGIFTILAHGFPYMINDENNQTMLAKQAIEKIKNDPKYKEGMPIKLYSCDTGKGTNPIAQDIANGLNVPVYAPTERVWIDRNGKVSVYGKIRGKKDLSKPGIFKKFIPK